MKINLREENRREADKVDANGLLRLLLTHNYNHIYYQNNELQEYVKQYGIIIESWYPFGGRGHTDENFNNETIVKIAKKYNKTMKYFVTLLYED